jgi:AAA15 family ATPase/GTPase
MPKAKKQDRITHLSRVVFEGYKSIDHLEIDLVKGLNILIGPNGSGKSNFLGLLDTVFNGFAALPWMQLPYNSAEILFNTESDKKIKWYTERNNERGKMHDEQVKMFPPEKGIYKREKLTVGKNEIFDSTKLTDDMFEYQKGSKVNIKYLRALPFLFLKEGLHLPGFVVIRYNLPEQLTTIDTSGNITVDKKSNSTELINMSTVAINTFFSNFVTGYLMPSIPFDRNKIDKQEVLKNLDFPYSRYSIQPKHKYLRR